jgi:hypothetical protein
MVLWGKIKFWFSAKNFAVMFSSGPPGCTPSAGIFGKLASWSFKLVSTMFNSPVKVLILHQWISFVQLFLVMVLTWSVDFFQLEVFLIY